MKKPAVILATALSTVALAGLIGVGVASADPTSSPTPGATATASPTAGVTPRGKPGKANRARAKHDLTRRALHGEVTLGGKKHQVVDFQRGAVTAVSATSITVRSTDDFSATYVVDAKTTVRHAKAKAAITDVKTGDQVRVVALKTGTTLTAKRVADRTK